MKIHKFKITDTDIQELRMILDGAYKVRHTNEYWDAIERWTDLLKEDVFDDED